jgi:hypothetical protein
VLVVIIAIFHPPFAQVFTRYGRAVLGFLTFCSFSIIVDIIFAAETVSDETVLFEFCYVMFCFSIVVKGPLLFYAARVFAELGGAKCIDVLWSDLYCIDDRSTQKTTGGADMHNADTSPSFSLPEDQEVQSPMLKGT